MLSRGGQFEAFLGGLFGPFSKGHFPLFLRGRFYRFFHIRLNFNRLKLGFLVVNGVMQNTVNQSVIIRFGGEKMT